MIMDADINENNVSTDDTESQQLERGKELEKENASVLNNHQPNYRKIAGDVYESILHLQDNLKEQLGSKYLKLKGFDLKPYLDAANRSRGEATELIVLEIPRNDYTLDT